MENYQTLSKIVSDKMQGDGGDDGHSFQVELEAACKRYVQSRILRQRSAMKKILYGETS